MGVIAVVYLVYSPRTPSSTQESILSTDRNTQSQVILGHLLWRGQWFVYTAGSRSGYCAGSRIPTSVVTDTDRSWCPGRRGLCATSRTYMVRTLIGSCSTRQRMPSPVMPPPYLRFWA